MSNSNEMMEQSDQPIPLGDSAFSVMARVAMQLGRESISNSIIAVTELVKNAYDADAELVTLHFIGLQTDAPLLIIEDNGNGMTEQQLRERWMVIGTPNKLLTARSSRKQRVLTGEKGLGRLGLDRLCEKAILQTFTETQSRGVELIIDWSKYENTDDHLEDIRHELYSIPKRLLHPVTSEDIHVHKGTRLILYGLKDSWTKEFLLDLKQELTLLVSPFAGISDFAIELYSGLNWTDIDGRIGSGKLLEVAEWKVAAEIQKDGQIKYVVSSLQHNKKFELGPISWDQRFQTKDHQPYCGPLTFEVYFFPRRSVDFQDLSFDRTQITSFLDANQGIRIYRDGFQVKPYGQPNGEGDWLKLSYRRQQSPAGVAQDDKIGGWRVGYNQVVGAVFITREQNHNLLDQTNREGIVGGLAFYDLKKFGEDAIHFFELSREEFERDRRTTNDYDKAREEAEKKALASIAAVSNLKGTADRVKSLLSLSGTTGVAPDVETINRLIEDAVQEIDTTVSNAQKAQDKFVEAAKEQQEEFQRQKDTLGNLASLGILTTFFGHETVGFSNVVLANARQLKQNLLAGLFMVTPDIREIVEENLDLIVMDTERIETFAKFTLRNVSRDKRSRKALLLDAIVRQIFASFAKSLQDKNIAVELNIAKESIAPIRAFQIDWESIFVNLLINAIWALQDTEAEKRKIRVSVHQIDGYIDISFADSGCGLAAGISDNIFLPTFTTKRNDKGEIIGTGMGLTIVRGFINEHPGASIEVLSPCDLGGAQFHIRVPVAESTLKEKDNVR